MPKVDTRKINMDAYNSMYNSHRDTNPWNRVASIAASASKDPWATLGAAIGTAWGDQYNARGEKKAEDEGMGVLDRLLSSGGTQQTQQPQQSYTLNQPQMPGSLSEARGDGKAIPGVLDGVKNAMQLQPATDGNFNVGAGLLMDSETRKLATNNQYLSRFTSDNPGADYRLAKQDTNQAQQILSQIADPSKLTWADVKKQAIETMRANGRTESQIGNVLPKIKEAYDERMGQYNEQRGTGYVQQAMEKLQKGDYNNAYIQAMAGMKYAPQQAQAVMGLLGRLQQQAFQKEQAQINFNRQMQLKQMELAARYGALGAGGVRGTRNVTTTSKKDTDAQTTDAQTTDAQTTTQGNGIDRWGYVPAASKEQLQWAWKVIEESQKPKNEQNESVLTEGAIERAKQIINNPDGFSGYVNNQATADYVATEVFQKLRNGTYNDVQAKQELDRIPSKLKENAMQNIGMWNWYMRNYYGVDGTYETGDYSHLSKGQNKSTPKQPDKKKHDISPKAGEPYDY